MKHFLSGLLVSLLLGSFSLGSAQVGQTSASVLSSPLLKDAKKMATGSLTLPDGSSLRLQERGGYLLSATVLVPMSTLGASAKPVTTTAGTATAVGTLPGTPATASVLEKASARTAELIGLLSGFGEGMAQPLRQFLSRSDVQQRLPGGLQIGAAPFDLHVQGGNGVLSTTISLTQVPAAQFAPTNNALSARKATAQPVVLRVYSDFQCPYCQKFEVETMPALLAKLPEDVRIEFHQFPLESIHPLARPSAEASECAAKQNKFWAYKDLLFTDRSWLQGNPSTAFIALAGKVGMDVGAFTTCLGTRAGKDAVDAGLQEAMRLGLNGTPTVFVGGYRAANAYDVDGLLKLIELARVTAAPASKP